MTREIQRRQDEAWRKASSLLWRGEIRATGLRVSGQLLLALVYVGALSLVIWEAFAGRCSAGDVILAISLAAQVNQQVTAAVGLHQELQRMARTLGDFRWIQELVTRRGPRGSAMPPDRITEGIALEGVSFAYPGSEHNVLENVNLRLLPGSTVAIVGENGAGKTTLVKLLCGFYEVSQGTIRVDGVDLKSFSLAAWRARIAAGFQDFVRFEFRARETVGLGHLPDIGSEHAVRAALSRARSDDVSARFEHGLETELGQSNPQGTELSMGQWQKLALGRAMMREDPLLLILDEPTSALDAEAEHLLFEQYAMNAKRVGRSAGAITVLISHRFSTVGMADQILVVSGRRISEVGTHAQLIQRDGLYAELYGLQAKAYG